MTEAPQDGMTTSRAADPEEVARELRRQIADVRARIEEHRATMEAAGFAPTPHAAAEPRSLAADQPVRRLARMHRALSLARIMLVRPSNRER